MVFSSLTFLCIFMPITFGMYLLMPTMRARNALLVIVSVIFYAYGEPIFVFLMIASTILNYFLGLAIGKREDGARTACLTIGVIVNLGILAVFKYTGMFVSTLDALTGLGLVAPTIALPFGISFYTFHALSYLIDVYRRDVEPQPRYSHVLLYTVFFPQLIAGPIVKYHDIADQLEERTMSVDAVAKGLRRFCYGLAKKVLIANTMATVADALFSTAPSSLNAPAAWLAAIAYLMQIYFDFSGYSDMAIGLGHMFGFTIKENFNYPYASASIKEFWRRWHISLSTWFKEYLYIPLGGNRKGKFRASLNRMIVFLLCGLWHGANWTFVVWGLIHGALLLFEGAVPMDRIPRPVRRVYTMLAVTLAFVIFRADTLAQGWAVIVAMFTSWDFSVAPMQILMAQLTPIVIVTLAFALVVCLPVRERAIAWVHGHAAAFGPARAISYVVAVCVLFLCIVSLSSGTYNPFIYFRF